MALGVHRKKTKRLTRRSSGLVEKITRSFGLKWINRDVDNSPPLLSKDKVERVSRIHALNLPRRRSPHDAEASATGKSECPTKKTKVLVSKAHSGTIPSTTATIAPHKEALVTIVPQKATPLEAPRWEGSSRRRDKAVS
ncbi:hypothetical protein BHE74_00025450 [Ensete ventricosum]|nr:hypothetical protein BHE74_00025450 [Ensete ventricosum]